MPTWLKEAMKETWKQIIAVVVVATGSGAAIWAVIKYMADYSPKTQAAYLDAVRNLAKYYMRSPDLLTEEDIRRFFLHLINVRKAARSTVTIHLAGIKFFYVKTLGREWPVFDIVRPQPTKKLPAVLSREEVRAILKRK